MDNCRLARRQAPKRIIFPDAACQVVDDGA